MKFSRGKNIVFLAAAAAISLLAGVAWMERGVVLEEWYLFRWRHADAAEKQKCFRALVSIGSVRVLDCLEAEGVLYLLDVGCRSRSCRSGARAFAEVRRHLGSLSEGQRFAIAWVGRGVLVFPPLEPGSGGPRTAEATESAKSRALAFLDEQWAAGAPEEEPCARWALLTALAVATPPGSKQLNIWYLGSGPSSSACPRCASHRAPAIAEMIGQIFSKRPIHCFAVPAAGSSHGSEFLRDLAEKTGGLHVSLRE